MELIGIIVGIAAGLVAVVAAIAGAIRWLYQKIFSDGSQSDPNVNPLQQGMSADERERLVRVEAQLAELQKGAAAPPEGSAPSEVAALAAQASDEIEEALSEAVALQDENKEREAIERLLTAYNKDMPPEAKSQLHLLAGNGFLNLSEYGQAEYHFRTSLAAGRTAESKEAEAAVLGNLGIIYRIQGDQSKARDHHEDSAAIYREIGNQLGEANALGNIGVAYGSQDDWPKAMSYFQQAFVIHRLIGDRLQEAHGLGNIGSSYLKLGEFGKAEGPLQQALAIEREIGDRRGEAQDLGNLGSVYMSLREYAKGRDHLHQALAIHREIGNRLSEANALGNLGLLAAATSDHDEACQRLNEALSIFDEIGAGGQGPDLARAKLQELGCDEGAQELSTSEDPPTG